VLTGTVDVDVTNVQARPTDEEVDAIAADRTTTAGPSNLTVSTEDIAIQYNTKQICIAPLVASESEALGDSV